MSHDINIALFERAAEMVTLFEGTLPAQVIELDIERGDLDALYQHVCYAESMAAQEEFEAHDIY